MGIITMIVIGLVAGLIARAIVPGRQSMGALATMLLGIVGSFVGGLLGSLFSSDGNLMDPAALGPPLVHHRRRRRAAAGGLRRPTPRGLRSAEHR